MSLESVLDGAVSEAYLIPNFNKVDDLLRLKLKYSQLEQQGYFSKANIYDIASFIILGYRVNCLGAGQFENSITMESLYYWRSQFVDLSWYNIIQSVDQKERKSITSTINELVYRPKKHGIIYTVGDIRNTEVEDLQNIKGIGLARAILLTTIFDPDIVTREVETEAISSPSSVSQSQ